MSSKRLWKNVPRQNSKSISRPPLPTPKIKPNLTTNTIDASQLKIKEVGECDQLNLEQTARFASSQLGEFARSNKFQRIIKQILSSNLSIKNECLENKKDEKLFWSLGVGKNLMLSISSKESFMSQKSLMIGIKQQVRELKKSLHYLLEYISIFRQQINQQKAKILEGFQKIEQSLRFKNRTYEQTIKRLEEKIQRQRQAFSQSQVDRLSIDNQLEAIMRQFEHTQQEMIKLKNQIKDKNQQNQNLKSENIGLTQENEKMQQQAFEYRQRLSQLDLEISKRIQQAINNNQLSQQGSVNPHQRVKNKRSIEDHKKIFYQSSEYYVDKFQSQEKAGPKLHLNHHRQKYNNSYETNPNEEANCENSKKYHSSYFLGLKTPEDHYRKHWSPRNQEATRKLNNMHHRIFGKASSLKQTNKRSANTSKSPNHLASLQSKLSALKGQIQRELRDAK